MAVLVAGGAVALFAGGDGEGGLIPDILDGGDDRETPAFEFRLRKVVAEPTTRTGPQGLRKQASGAAEDVKTTLDALYGTAFVDPATWGEFETIAELFDGVARAQAEADLDVLMIGTAADAVEFVEPQLGRLSVDVLTDDKDRAAQAIAKVRFQAVAEGSDGQNTLVASFGTFYLHEVDGSWLIYGYRLDRADRPAPVTPTTSPTASPEASG